MPIPSNARAVFQGADQVIPVYPENSDTGERIAIGLQATDVCRMELRESYSGKVVQLMTSPKHFTITPGAAGVEQLDIKLYAEEMVTWDLTVLKSEEAEGAPKLDENGKPIPLAQILYGSLLISDTSGNSRAGSGIPVVLALEISMTRSAGAGGI